MKQLFLGIVIGLVSITGCFAGDRDFGLRLETGTLSGITDTIRLELALLTDFFFLSEHIRMVFGPIAFLPQNGDLGVLHTIGIDSNIPVGKDQIFVGIQYFKSYLQEDRGDFKGRLQGWGGYVGYKWRQSPLMDIVTTAGVMDQPLEEGEESVSLDEVIVFVRVGVEWYY